MAGSQATANRGRCSLGQQLMRACLVAIQRSAATWRGRRSIVWVSSGPGCRHQPAASRARAERAAAVHVHRKEPRGFEAMLIQATPASPAHSALTSLQPAICTGICLRSGMWSGSRPRLSCANMRSQALAGLNRKPRHVWDDIGYCDSAPSSRAARNAASCGWSCEWVAFCAYLLFQHTQ